MEFIVLDTKEATEEQLLGTINANIRTARLVSSEVEKLRRVSESIRKHHEFVQKQKITPSDTISSKQSKDQAFEDEVAYYYSLIKTLSSEELKNRFEELLPSRNNHQYERILRRIQMELARNIKEIKEFITTEELSQEDISDLAEEILRDQEKISIIGTSLTLVETPVITEEPAKSEGNNLIFVPTSGGNIRVLDELDHIAPEYYSRFATLFQSIKDGTFKNLVRHTNHSDLDGLFMVKDFKVRVAFTRLNENSYAIISAYTQKADSDKTIRTSLTSKYTDYQRLESNLIANLGNEEFISINKQYEEELFRRLSPTPEKTPVKTKVGDK